MFTRKSIRLRDVSAQDIKELRTSFTKLREQKWFKEKITGGFFYIELIFNLETTMCNPHLHALFESHAPVSTKPINIAEVNSAWNKLTEGQAQTPQALNTYEDKERMCSYIIKQESQGEETLNKLTKRIEILKNDMKFTVENTQDDIKDIKYIVNETLECLLEDINLTEDLHDILTKIYNTTFENQKRYSFFGTWFGDRKIYKEMKKIYPWSCQVCGSTESEIVYN